MSTKSDSKKKSEAWFKNYFPPGQWSNSNLINCSEKNQRNRWNYFRADGSSERFSHMAHVDTYFLWFLIDFVLFFHLSFYISLLFHLGLQLSCVDTCCHHEGLDICYTLAAATSPHRRIKIQCRDYKGKYDSDFRINLSLLRPRLK